MVTLFQLHANMDNLKSNVKELSRLWHPGDGVLLLGQTAAYLDWFDAYVMDINADDDFKGSIKNIDSIYILSSDIDRFKDNLKLNTDFTKVTLLTDEKWVMLTQEVDRVITLGTSL